MENNNSVCYVARIGELIPIPGADNIEVALAGGWQAIIKKGEYKVNVSVTNNYDNGKPPKTRPKILASIQGE